jgi:hypothetical protein
MPTTFPSFVRQLPPLIKLGLVMFIGLKLAWLTFLPLTGDEAYFIVWAEHPDAGFYDHPPMVGWVLFLAHFLGDQLWIYRSIAFATSLMISWVLYAFLRLGHQYSVQTASWVALIAFVSPLSLAFSLTTNDTLLVLFATLGVYFYAKCLTQPNWTNAALTGLMLGAAFLSKYFAVFLFLGLLLHWLFVSPRLHWKYLALIMAIMLAAVSQNLIYNAGHCWTNILFNFYSRVEASKSNPWNIPTYFATLLLLFWPVAVYYLLRAHRLLTTSLTPRLKIALYAGLPFLILLIPLSYKAQIGLHWPLMSVLILLSLMAILPTAQLRKAFVLTLVSGITLGIAGLGALVWATYQTTLNPTSSNLLYTQPQNLCAALPKNNLPLFTLGYTEQSILSVSCGLPDLHNFASLSKYGREDDKHTDYAKLDGQNLALIVFKEKHLEVIEPFFQTLQTTNIQLNENTHLIWVIGENFNYHAYRAQILKQVDTRYYAQPTWMKSLSSGCFFKEKYGFE